MLHNWRHGDVVLGVNIACAPCYPLKKGRKIATKSPRSCHEIAMKSPLVYTGDLKSPQKSPQKSPLKSPQKSSG